MDCALSSVQLSVKGRSIEDCEDKISHIVIFQIQQNISKLYFKGTVHPERCGCILQCTSCIDYFQELDYSLSLHGKEQQHQQAFSRATVVRNVTCFFFFFGMTKSQIFHFWVSYLVRHVELKCFLKLLEPLHSGRPLQR